MRFVTQTGHEFDISSVALAPDGRFAISGGRDKTAKLWDLSTGKEIFTIFHGHEVNQVSFSHDGRYASLCGGSVVKVWNITAGQEVYRFESKSGPIWSAAFHPKNSELLLFGHFDKGYKATVTNITEKSMVKNIDIQTSYIRSILFSPDGSSIIVGGNHTKIRNVGLIEIIDYETGSQRHMLEGHANYVMNMAVSPNGRSLATTSMDKTVKVWDISTGKNICSIGPQKDITSGIAFDPTGSNLAVTVPFTGTPQIKKGVDFFKADTCQHIRHLPLTKGGHAVAYSLAFLSDGSHFLTSGTPTPRLWHTENGSETFIFGNKPNVKWLGKMALSRDGRYVAVANDRNIIVWDLHYAKRYREYKNITVWSSPLLIGKDNRTLIYTKRKNKLIHVMFADLHSGIVTRELQGSTDFIYSLSLSPDGSIIAIGGGELKKGWLHLWDLGKGEIAHKIEGLDSAIESVCFSPDGHHIISGSLKGSVTVWKNDMSTALWQMKEGARSGVPVIYSRDGKTVFYPKRDQIIIRDAETGNLLHTYKGHRERVSAMALSPDGKLLVSGDIWGNVKLWDISAGHEVRSLVSRNAMEIKDLSFSPDGRHALICSGVTLRLWDLLSGRTLSMISMGDEWLVYMEDGLFDASYNGASLVAMVKDQHGYGIDQLALKNNRPDLIMEQFGMGTPDLLAHYKARYLYRLKKAGFVETDLSSKIDLPEARIITTSGPDGNGVVDVVVELKDRKSLKSYQFYVNDVPVFEPGGKEIAGEKVLRKEKVELTDGTNKIEVSAINSRGQESLRALKVIQYKGENAGELYYLGFGVSRYKDRNLNLDYAHKDALDLAAVFSKARNYRQVHIKTLTDEQVTAKTIKESKEFLKHARPEDSLILFIAGHGIHDRDDRATYYFITHDTDTANLSSTAASFEWIEDLLMGIKPRRKLFLMDTCESGEGGEKVESRTFDQALHRGLKARTSRAIIIKGDKDKKEASREYLLQKDRFIYADLARRSGAIVFSSSRGGEFSYENAAEKNGYFTKEILRALTTESADINKDGAIDTDELRLYVSRKVAEHTNGMQNPTVDRDNIYQKFSLPIIKP